MKEALKAEGVPVLDWERNLDNVRLYASSDRASSPIRAGPGIQDQVLSSFQNLTRNIYHQTQFMNLNKHRVLVFGFIQYINRLLRLEHLSRIFFKRGRDSDVDNYMTASGPWQVVGGVIWSMLRTAAYFYFKVIQPIYGLLWLNLPWQVVRADSVAAMFFAILT